ncbi:MAG: type II toxin-antitoxin system prevent-host-death family antitoxin [Candidatus Eremiobacteraeota bacterium]|nr:type II toxin-antitoxin system prevent-host-death family antitoxin [Candidatus Eremiobacteraeota bacterium]MBC5803282.1 type II toxin-antitoxin system prevent-host-death family antitoxin [Candidatus Eremiobacteraeota bacterium]MBC5822190.1 type II toxin-antitoxin system prevent-host-death family antitoxin [Candidatus Eremiobacteraeota bacterium]
MRSASLRQVQHNLGEVLRWIDAGEEVEITRRRKPVARLVPVGGQPRPVDWDEHFRALHAIFAQKPPKGSPASDLVIEQRNARG